MKIRQFVLLLSIIAWGSAFSQIFHIEDAVYLKNGSVIKGFITEEKPGVSITIRTADDNLFVFQIQDIEKITHNKAPAERMHRKPPVTDAPKSPFMLGMEYTYHGSLRQYETGNISGLYGKAGYRLTPSVSAFFGMGIENYYEQNWIPVFAEVTAELKPGAVQPFVYAKAGYNSPTRQDEYYQRYYGGMLYGVGFGIQTPLAGNTSLVFSLGYRYQYFQYESYIYPEPLPYPVPEPGNTNGGETGSTPDPGTNPGFDVKPPEIWPPNDYYYPAKVSTHGHFITFTAGIKF